VGSDKDSFENEFSFDSSYAAASEEFKQVMASKTGGYLSGVTSFYGRYASKPTSSTSPRRKRSSLHNELIDNIADYLDLYDTSEGEVTKRRAVELLNECYFAFMAQEPDEGGEVEKGDSPLEKALEEHRTGISEDEVPF
jgi:hypothetical protein